ncbi:hypothetical protein AVEN_232440-1 [Araneus ventricosus]|uniref:Mos1 transposase HTH domain-containing protein n=1 Tax=Araneus ventricosus TaxID=182803 RepID=A0A4Y2QBC2_ARAVE|nr:hypothetical protein AVEN_232440-1 [Araneus ventricosus]
MRRSRLKRFTVFVHTSSSTEECFLYGIVARILFSIYFNLYFCIYCNVARFLQAEGNIAADIHRQLCRIYGENFICDGVVHEKCRKCKEGRTDIHDGGEQGQMSVTTEDLLQGVDQVVRQKQKFNTSELCLQFSKVSRSSLYMMVTEHLRYKKKVLGGFIKMLSDDHKARRKASDETFITCCSAEGFLKSIVTGEMTWIQCVNSETNELSKQLIHSS